MPGTLTGCSSGLNRSTRRWRGQPAESVLEWMMSLVPVIAAIAAAMVIFAGVFVTAAVSLGDGDDGEMHAFAIDGADRGGQPA